MEYSIGNIYVAFSWSDYFTSFLHRLGVHLPDYLATSYAEAKNAFLSHSANTESVNAWKTAPLLGGLRIIFDLPALLINIGITALVYVGVKESKNFTNLMVLLKLITIVMVICVGAYFIDPGNWNPVRGRLLLASDLPITVVMCTTAGTAIFDGCSKSTGPGILSPLNNPA